MIADNLAAIRKRIEDAAARAGRDPDQVRIVAAAKTQSDEKIREAVAAGIGIIGHNYVQEAARHLSLPGIGPVEMHMIGHLQTNKAGKAAELFQVIETVDSVRLANALQRRAQEAGKTLGVLIQVNIAEEPQKSGIAEQETGELAEAIRGLSSLRLLGLMTMPPFFDDPDRARPYFARLHELQQSLMAKGILAPEMSELSMGMTGDFEVAVEEAATLVRIGTALFGPRG
jgi:pyridoxal phosphate enzyme (YggS family)